MKPGPIDNRVRTRDGKKVRLLWDRKKGYRSQKGHQTGEVRSVGWTGGDSGSTNIEGPQVASMGKGRMQDG